MSDWIKIRKSLIDDPAVLCMSKELGMSREEVVGHLVKFWSWVDSHIADGNDRTVTDVTPLRYIVVTEVLDCLVKYGWLEVSEDGIRIPHFDRHLSHSAKKRALTKERVNRWRNATVTQRSLPDQIRSDDERERDEATPTPERTDGNKDPSDAWQRAELELPRHQKVKNPHAYILKCREKAKHPSECFKWFEKNGTEATPTPADCTQEAIQDLIHKFKKEKSNG